MAITLKNNIIYLMLMKNQLVLASEINPHLILPKEQFGSTFWPKHFTYCSIKSIKTKLNGTEHIKLSIYNKKKKTEENGLFFIRSFGHINDLNLQISNSIYRFQTQEKVSVEVIKVRVKIAWIFDHNQLAYIKKYKTGNVVATSGMVTYTSVQR